MIKNQNIANLICALELKIGNQTYNPNSYNGWTGEEGCSFRYPVKYCKNEVDLEEHNLTSTKNKIRQIDPDCIETIKYTFGSNHLYIGNGLVKVLEYLEDRYNLDFNKLENNIIKNKKKALRKAEEKLAIGDIIEFDCTPKVVGLDIPAGEYKIINFKRNDLGILIIDIYNSKYEKKDTLIINEDSKKVIFREGDIIKSFYSYGLKK